MSNLPDLNSLWNYDHPDDSERSFRALLPAAHGNLPYELELLTQIARAQGLQRHFDAGQQSLDEVERRLTSNTETAHVRLLLERGRLFNSAGDPGRARPLFMQAWELAQQIGEVGYAVDAAHMLGILDAPDLSWNLKALELAENSSDERARRWRASLYNNIGWAYHDQGEYDKALGMFGKALRLREDQGDAKLIRIARWSVARTLRSLKRIDEALEILRRLDREGESDGYIEEEIGECLLTLGRTDEAKPYFARAYAELSLDEWFAEHEAEHLERLRVLGS